MMSTDADILPEASTPVGRHSTGGVSLDATRGRDDNLDLLRVAACLSVVMLHTSARTIYLYGQVSMLSWNAGNLIDSATRWCVPVFVMISGALLLSKPIPDMSNFLKRRARTIVIPTIVWSLVYLEWRRRAYGEHFTFASGLREILSGFPYYHLYFLFLVAGLYVFAPAIACVLHALPRRQTIAMASTAVVIAAVTTCFQGLSSNALTQFIPYIGFFALGFLLKNIVVSRVLLAMIVTCSVLVTATATFLTVRNGGVNGPWGLYFYSYFSPSVIVMSIAVFMFFMNVGVGFRFSSFLARFVPLTLGIYVLHPMILELLRREWSRIAPNLLAPLFDVPVTFTLAITISAACVWIIKRVPVIRMAV